MTTVCQEWFLIWRISIYNDTNLPLTLNRSGVILLIFINIQKKQKDFFEKKRNVNRDSSNYK